MKKNLNIKIGGQAGEGIKVTGLIAVRSFTRLGFSTFSYSEYPSLIRGGHNTYQIHIGVNKVYSQIKKVDLLIAFNQKAITLHQDELGQNSLIIYDPDKFSLPKKTKLAGKYLPIRLAKLAQDTGGKAIMANMVSLGAITTLCNLPLNSLSKVIEEKFSKKSPQIADLNKKAAVAGKEFVEKEYSNMKLKIARPENNQKRMILTGNEAAALGAIAGGLQAYLAYPMTPATSILHYLAAKAPDAKILVKHPEDEISTINMAIGSSFAGARTMVATSGGGLCLMAEAIGLAGISETPIVIINSMRPGPGVGVPTWTGQSDLQFCLHISNDEFPKIVLTPGDVTESFELTKLALKLAEKYQLPVIIVIDKFISESDYSCLPFAEIHKNKRYSLSTTLNEQNNKPFPRYKAQDNGISLRSLPGQPGGVHCSSSYEHDEYGFTNENAATRTKMMKNRMKKLESAKREMFPQPIFGSKQAKIGIISWGSNKVVIQEALKQLPNTKFLHLNWIWPFPDYQVEKFITSCEKVICPECNSQGQLANLIREQTGHKIEKFLKFNGRPFYPKEIIERLK